MLWPDKGVRAAKKVGNPWSKGSQNQIIFKPMWTTGDKLQNGKDPVHPFDCQSAVYWVPCGHCNQKYFGKTKWSLNTCKKEHINHTKHFHLEKSVLTNMH